MTSSIINWIVDKYLSNILEINQEETKSSLWSGEFEMSNLKIKPEIFANMNLPYFELVHGYVGKLKISMSLPRFYLYPIKVEIDKVFFHAKQKKLETINKKTEIENMESYKKNQLQSAEELTNEINTLQSEGTPSMTSQIINNLEIVISDICVRFDDELSYNLIPFSFGLLLKNLKIKTVDSNFKEAEEGETIPFAEINNKIIQMTNLSIFLDTFENEGKLVGYHTKIVNNEKTEVTDEKIINFLGPLLEYYRYCLSEINENIDNKDSHQYLAFNLGFLLKLSMNENLKNGNPQYVVDCQLQNIDMSMSLVQIKALLKLLAYQDLNSKYQLGLSKEYYTKKIKEEEKLNYIENYIEYYKAKYGYRKNEQQAEILKPALTQVENGLKYEEIEIMRNAAKYKMFHDKEIDDIDEKIENLKGGSGFWSYFSSGPTEEQKKEIEKLEQMKNKLIEENVDETVKQKLKLAQSVSENTANSMSDIPSDFCLYKVKLTLPMFNFDINRQIEEKMISLVFNKFEIETKINKEGQFFSLLIGDFSIKQYQLKETVYETLLASVEQKDDNNEKDLNIEKQGAVYMEFENNPKYEKSNFRFKFRNTKRMVITVNLYSIQYLLNKVLDSLATTISKFGTERYIGTGEIQNLIKSGFETNYISGGYQHFNIDLDIVMKSPIIIYPQDILDKYNTKCLLIRCGDFEIKSDLPPRQDLNKNYALIDDRSLLFDVYKMNSANFYMSTYKYFDGDFQTLLKSRGKNLVDDIPITFRFESMFEQNNTFFEKMKIYLGLGKCKFNLRDTQIIFFIDLLEKMQKNNKILSFDLEKKTPFEEMEAKQNKEDLEKEEKEKEENEKHKKELELEKENQKKLLMKLTQKEKSNKEIEQKEKEKEKKKINAKDSKYLNFEFNIDSIELCLIKSISFKERKIISSLDKNLYEKKYRDFIVFQLNEFHLGVLMTEKGNMDVDLSILSSSIKDKETYITDISNPKGDLLINKEFQEMLQMYTVSKNIMRGSVNLSGKSSYSFKDVELLKEEENENEQVKNNKFLLVEYRYDGISKKQKVNVIMQKIRICFSMSTMARLYQFYSHYYGMYSQSCENITLVMAEMEERYKKDKLKNILQFKYGQKNSSSEISDTSSYISGSEVTEEDEEITKMIKEEIDKKKLFGKDFANVLNKDLKEMKTLKENNINTNSINNNDDIGLKPSQTNIYFNEIAEESMKNKKDRLSKILKETKEKSEIDIKFEMKESLLEFPLDDTKSKTKVLRFQHNFICTMTMDSEYYMTVDGNGKLIETKYITNNKKLCAKFLNISFSIANFTNGIYSIDNICDQMLQGFRFSTNLNQFLLLPYKERSVMLIDVIFEPLVFNIGFRQTKALMKFLPKISEFLTDMYKEYDDPLKEVDINKYEKMSEFLSGNEKGNVIHESEEKILADVSEEELEKKEAKKKKKIQKYKILQKQKEVRNFIQQKKKELVEQKLKQVQAKTNIDDINYMMSVKVIIDKTSFKFMDDTGEYLIPLLSIDITQVLVRYIQNSNTDSVENVSNLILESISRKSIPLEEYDINGLSMYVEMGFNTDIHFYNDRINNWEPIIERYSGLLKIDQVTSFSRMRILFKSDDIFNLNVSISSMNILNKVIKKFGENEEMWDIDKPEENNDVTKNVSDKVAIEFLNISGVDIDCWLDAQEIINTDNNNQLYKFTLDSNNKNCKKIRRNFLSKIYQRLSETQLKMKKDKFSFKIKGYVTIYGNDLSSNYTSSFRMKSKKFANERVGSVYEKIKPKQRTKSDNKNINDANNLTIQSLEMRTNSVILEGLLDDDTESLKEQENNQNKNINDEIEVLVKVRQNGTMKSIVFESNIFIFNNLQVPISLSLISQNDFVNLYKSDEKNINHFDNKNKIVINTGVRKSIPLSYIINKYRIYISFYNKENEKDNNYSLLYENFVPLKENLNDFIKYNEENSSTYKGVKSTVLKDKYSKLISLQKNNKQFYISSNLILQRGNNDVISDIVSNVSNKNYQMNYNNSHDSSRRSSKINTLIESMKNDFYSKTFSYLFILDESLTLENQIPFNIKCSLIQSTNTKEFTIKPLESREFLDVDMETSKIQLKMTYHEKNFLSDNYNIKDLKEKNSSKITINDNDNKQIMEIKLHDENIKEKYILCNLKVFENLSNDKIVGAFEREYEYSVFSFQQKKKFLFYTKCIIINRSDYLLYMLSEGEKNYLKNDLYKENYNCIINPLSVNLMNTNDVKKAFKLKCENSDWSDKFNINTIGNYGEASLNVVDKNNKNKITIIDVGIKISSSWYFTNSLLITIEPRFLFVNKLGIDIQFKQYNNKLNKEENEKNALFEIMNIKNNDILKLNTYKGNKHMKKMIQIKLNESDSFSCPFDLESTGEIDLKIPINNDTKKYFEEKNKEIDIELKKNKLEKEKNKEKEIIKDQEKKEQLVQDIKNENDINIIINNDNNDNVINTDNKNNENANNKDDNKKELSPEEEQKLNLKKQEEKLEKIKMKPRKYILFKQNNQDYLLVHVVKTAYGGLIYVVIFPPLYPQYIISNESKERIIFKQKKDEYGKELFSLEKGESIPYVWGDLLKNEKKLIAIINESELEINFHEIKIIQKEFEIKKNEKTKKNKFYFQTIVENNRTRKLIIKNENIKKKNRGYFLQILNGQNKSFSKMYFKIDTKGIGLSIINNEPREIFYISGYGGIIDGNMFSFKKDGCEHSITNIKLIIKNFQIDYCLEDNFKSMIIPLNQITPQIEETANKKGEVLTPLFEGIISFHNVINPLTQISSDEFPQLDLTLQSFKLNISQYQLMSLLTLYNQIMPELDFYLGIPEKKIEYNNIDDLEQLFNENNEKKELIYPPEHYDNLLNLNFTALPEEVIYDSENHWMFFMKNIAIGAMDIIISTRIDINSFGAFLPSVFMGIISALGNVFTHITDYHLKFTSLIYTDVFTDIYNLSSQLTNEYISQTKRRIFQILGSLDILGNPTSYASSIGEGFIQLFEAPRKGLINGPLGLGEGIAKGFGTFITTIISSTFDVVGKISGTLLASCEVLQGKKTIEQLEDREPENVLDGLYKGIKDGIVDIGKGIGGILYKPYEGGKESGIKGFFKGIGSGLIGAVVSPFTASLRIANNLFVGLKNTANIFNPKLKTDRFRYPRSIEKSLGLKSYDEDKATVQAILDFFKCYKDCEIVYFKNFKYISNELGSTESMFILTDKWVLVVYQAKEVMLEIELCEIKSVEVHQELGKGYFDLIFYMKNEDKNYIRTNDLSLCSEFYLLFIKSKE